MLRCRKCVHAKDLLRCHVFASNQEGILNGKFWKSEWNRRQPGMGICIRRCWAITEPRQSTNLDIPGVRQTPDFDIHYPSQAATYVQCKRQWISSDCVCTPFQAEFWQSRTISQASRI